MPPPTPFPSAQASSAQAGATGNAAPGGQAATPPPSPSVPSGSSWPPRTSTWKKVGGWLGAAAVFLIYAVSHGIGIFFAHHSPQVASLFRNPFAPHQLATSLRLYQQGDSWEYNVRGTLTRTDGKTALFTNSTIRSEMSTLEASGNFRTLTEEDTAHFTASLAGNISSLSQVIRQTLSQDSLKATTFLMSDNNGPQNAVRTVRQPQVDTPGEWAAGATQTVHLDFDNGEHKDETTTVSGSEVVDTALGKFSVWRCVQDEKDSDGSQSTTLLWFAPQLGMPVKTEGTFHLPDGTVMTLNTDLTKTSVPL